MKLESMTTTERSLLLHLESCSTDHAGRVHPGRINADDCTILDAWVKSGFVTHGRIIVADHNRDGSLWVRLSEEAWSLAHAERRARSDRMWKNRSYQTTAEKRTGKEIP